MMQQAVEIPAPSGADTETVITALETAAVFRARGDRQEAMRWLRRAAESAGEAGDDHRALSLSRAAADLHEELESAVEAKVPEPEAMPVMPTTPAPPPLPAPPSSRAARSPAASARTSHPPPPSARGARPSSAPRASYPPRPSSRPSYLSGARPPVSAQARASTAPKIEAAAPVVVEAEPKVEPPRPPPLPVESARPTLAPAPAMAATPAESAPISSPLAPSSGPARTGARMAARVAVTISTTKAGVFEVRLLADGESPRIGSSEAMLVMLDPATTLLLR